VKVPSLPNLLTLFRLAAAPAVLAIFACAARGGGRVMELPPEALWACLGLALVSEVSDGLDGFLARRRNVVSNFGKLMDPCADSIFRLSCFFCFAGAGWAPLWMVVVMFYRDMGVGALRTFAAERGVIVAARFAGKCKALVQAGGALAILAIALGEGGIPSRQALGTFEILAWIAMAASVISGGEYAWAARAMFREKP